MHPLNIKTAMLWLAGHILLRYLVPAHTERNQKNKNKINKLEQQPKSKMANGTDNADYYLCDEHDAIKETP